MTRAIEEMLEGQAEAITQKAVDMALKGGGPDLRLCLRLCLERLAPPSEDVTVRFDLPAMESAKTLAGPHRRF